jgi:thiol-disulfide isomerase/thioredoxin
MSGRVPAPEFPESLTWVNTRAPERLGALRGRVVVLHFWNASNIHAMQALPDLRHLEAKYGDSLSVLSIHVPKFTRERDANAVLKAVNRHYIRHPVASDPDFLAWQLYGAKAWPSFVVIDAHGRFAGSLAGEGRRVELDSLVGHLLEEATRDNVRVIAPAVPVKRNEPKLPLRFPSKLLATDTHLYISDSGHNRVLECTHDGRILRQFGSGNPGFWDGIGSDAGFAQPGGLALSTDALFVADRGNHAIRRIRLQSGEVETYAGTGTLGRFRGVDLPPRETPMSSPWDIALSGERLHIALAGQHQIATLDLGRARLSTLAGTGSAGVVDGAANDSRFAKPTGIVAGGASLLFVACAEGSSVRVVSLPSGHVRTIAGTDLYDFGDADGSRREQIRLQQPTALAFDARSQVLWVADAYNDKLKMISLRDESCRTFKLEYRLHEPGGLSIGAGSLWIANTNAHEIVRVDLGSGVAKRVPVGE